MTGTLYFQIYPASGVPIYQQLIDQINDLIASGRLKAGDKLPSVREVSKMLEVNPMTISKAYSLLEKDGVLLRRSGQGMYVAERGEYQLSLQERLEKLRGIAQRLVTAAHQLDLNQEQVQNTVKALFEEIDHE